MSGQNSRINAILQTKYKDAFNSSTVYLKDSLNEAQLAKAVQNLAQTEVNPDSILLVQVQNNSSACEFGFLFCAEGLHFKLSNIATYLKYNDIKQVRFLEDEMGRAYLSLESISQGKLKLEFKDPKIQGVRLSGLAKFLNALAQNAKSLDASTRQDTNGHFNQDSASQQASFAQAKAEADSARDTSFEPNSTKTTAKKNYTSSSESCFASKSEQAEQVAQAKHTEHTEYTEQAGKSEQSNNVYSLIHEKVLKESYKVFTERLYLAPSIPENKFQGAVAGIAKYQLTQEQVLLVHDQTFFGSASDGSLATNEGFYYRMGDNAFSFKYADLISARALHKSNNKYWVLIECKNNQTYHIEDESNGLNLVELATWLMKLHEAALQQGMTSANRPLYELSSEVKLSFAKAFIVFAFLQESNLTRSNKCAANLRYSFMSTSSLALCYDLYARLALNESEQLKVFTYFLNILKERDEYFNKASLNLAQAELNVTQDKEDTYSFQDVLAKNQQQCLQDSQVTQNTQNAQNAQRAQNAQVAVDAKALVDSLKAKLSRDMLEMVRGLDKSGAFELRSCLFKEFIAYILLQEHDFAFKQAWPEFQDHSNCSFVSAEDGNKCSTTQEDGNDSSLKHNAHDSYSDACYKQNAHISEPVLYELLQKLNQEQHAVTKLAKDDLTRKISQLKLSENDLYQKIQANTFLKEMLELELNELQVRFIIKLLQHEFLVFTDDCNDQMLSAGYTALMQEANKVAMPISLCYLSGTSFGLNSLGAISALELLGLSSNIGLSFGIVKEGSLLSAGVCKTNQLISTQVTGEHEIEQKERKMVLLQGGLEFNEHKLALVVHDLHLLNRLQKYGQMAIVTSSCEQSFLIKLEQVANLLALMQEYRHRVLLRQRLPLKLDRSRLVSLPIHSLSPKLLEQVNKMYDEQDRLKTDLTSVQLKHLLNMLDKLDYFSALSAVKGQVQNLFKLFS